MLHTHMYVRVSCLLLGSDTIRYPPSHMEIVAAFDGPSLYGIRHIPERNLAIQSSDGQFLAVWPERMGDDCNIQRSGEKCNKREIEERKEEAGRERESRDGRRGKDREGKKKHAAR